MKLIAVKVEGFRSFAERMEFKFPDHAGLYLVRGENKAQPSLGANGAGKSTFWDSICWAFYGKTARGLGGPHVESWQECSNGTEVAVTFEADGYKNTIVRGRKPIRLLLNGVPASQDEIDDILAMSYERFLQVALLGQFGTLFADMKPTARLDLISEVLELELWSAAAMKAAEELKERQVIVEHCTVRVARLVERTATLREQLARSKEDRERWAGNMREELVNLDSNRERAKSKYEVVSDRLAKLELQLGIDEKEQARATKRLRDWIEKQGLLTATRSEVEADRRVASSRLNNAKDDANTIGVLGAKCEVCQQEVTREHRRHILDKANDLVEKAYDEHEKLKAQLARIDKEVDDFNAQRKELSVAETAAMGVAAKTRNAVRDLGREVGELKSKLDVANAEAKKLKLIANPHEAQVAKLENDIGRTDLELTEQESQLVDARNGVLALEPWPKRFKELRLWVVEEALGELEIEVNSSMVELGLKGWKIQFIVERETQAGGVSRGFEILVISPASPEGVPWESWSGGETQRLRVACAVGLASLIRARMPSAPDFEAWDEPTSHLNREGVADLVAFFAGRADERQVWIIDHRSLDSGQFDRVLTVTKTKKGSRLTMA